GEAAHLVNEVHGLFRTLPGRDGLGYEEADDLALAGAHLLGHDRQLGRQPGQLEGALGRVVVGQRDAVETELVAARDQRLQAGGAVRRVLGVEVEVDSEERAAAAVPHPDEAALRSESSSWPG